MPQQNVVTAKTNSREQICCPIRFISG